MRQGLVLKLQSATQVNEVPEDDEETPSHADRLQGIGSHFTQSIEVRNDYRRASQAMPEDQSRLYASLQVN